jgi:hypothetical protein
MIQKFTSMESLKEFWDNLPQNKQEIVMVERTSLPSMVKVAAMPPKPKTILTHRTLDANFVNSLHLTVSKTPMKTDTNSGIERIQGE